MQTVKISHSLPVEEYIKTAELKIYLALANAKNDMDNV